MEEILITTDLIDRIFAEDSAYLRRKIGQYLGCRGGAKSSKRKYEASLENLVKARLAHKKKIKE